MDNRREQVRVNLDYEYFKQLESVYRKLQDQYGCEESPSFSDICNVVIRAGLLNLQHKMLPEISKYRKEVKDVSNNND